MHTFTTLFYFVIFSLCLWQRRASQDYICSAWFDSFLCVCAASVMITSEIDQLIAFNFHQFQTSGCILHTRVMFRSYIVRSDLNIYIYIFNASYLYEFVVVCTDLWGKELYRQAGVGIVMTSGKPTWCNGSTLARNARDVGLSPALGTVFLIFITPMTILKQFSPVFSLLCHSPLL